MLCGHWKVSDVIRLGLSFAIQVFQTFSQSVVLRFSFLLVDFISFSPQLYCDVIDL